MSVSSVFTSKFGIPLANVEVPLASDRVPQVTEADIYEDSVTIYEGDQVVAALTVDSAIALAHAILEAYKKV